MVVNPLAIGVETVGGVFEKLVPRNYIIPLVKRKTFSTVRDNQEKVVIKVFGGERSLTKYNKFVTEVVLTGIPPAPKGVPLIEVIFEINADEEWTIETRLMDSREMELKEKGRVLAPAQKPMAQVKVIARGNYWPLEMIDEMIMDAEDNWDEDEFVRMNPPTEPRKGGEDEFGIVRVQEQIHCPHKPNVGTWGYLFSLWKKVMTVKNGYV
jgi:molecular chaperone DnaK (HSP70)